MRILSEKEVAELHESAKEFGRQGASELFKSLIDTAAKVYKETGKPVKVMDFKFCFGTVQLNYINYHEDGEHVLALYDEEKKHGYTKYFGGIFGEDYEAFYIEILRELNFIREIRNFAA